MLEQEATTFPFILLKKDSSIEGAIIVSQSHSDPNSLEFKEMKVKVTSLKSDLRSYSSGYSWEMLTLEESGEIDKDLFNNMGRNESKSYISNVIRVKGLFSFRGGESWKINKELSNNIGRLDDD